MSAFVSLKLNRNDVAKTITLEKTRLSSSVEENLDFSSFDLEGAEEEDLIYSTGSNNYSGLSNSLLIPNSVGDFYLGEPANFMVTVQVGGLHTGRQYQLPLTLNYSQSKTTVPSIGS